MGLKVINPALLIDHVQAPPALDRRVATGLHLSGIGHVAPHHQGLIIGPGLAGGVFTGVGTKHRQHHPRALVGEAFDDGGSDPAVRARDDRYLVFESAPCVSQRSSRGLGSPSGLRKV